MMRTAVVLRTLLLVLLCSAPFARAMASDTGREWMMPGRTQMIFGTPETDDVVVTLQCAAGDRLLMTVAGSGAPTIVLSNEDGARMRVEALDVTRTFGEETYIESEVRLEPDAAPLTWLLDGSRLHVEVGGDVLDVSDAGFARHFEALRSSCEKKKDVGDESSRSAGVEVMDGRWFVDHTEAACRMVMRHRDGVMLASIELLHETGDIVFKLFDDRFAASPVKKLASLDVPSGERILGELTFHDGAAHILVGDTQAFIDVVPIQISVSVSGVLADEIDVSLDGVLVAFDAFFQCF